MVYILGTNLKNHKKLKREILSIRGIRRIGTRYLFATLGLNPNLRVGSLTNRQTIELLNQINRKFYVGSEINSIAAQDIKRLININSVRGIHHSYLMRTRERKLRQARQANLKKLKKQKLSR